MKYFSCQPDSHNGFGLLLGHTLIYFTVECTKQKRAGDNSDDTPGDGESVTEMKVQSAVTLPQGFGRAPECFSMANRSLYGCDLAFVGSSSGVVAVLAMSTNAVLYAPRRNPTSLRKLHNDTATAHFFATPTTTTTTTTTNNNNNNNSNNDNSPAIQTALLKVFGHLVPPLSLPQASISGIGSSLPSAPPRQSTKMDYGVGTVTWMRDKPLVFVGLKSGHVEWYHVTIAAAKQGEVAARGMPASMTESTSSGAKNVSERRSSGVVPIPSEGTVNFLSDSHTLSRTICMHGGFHRHDATQKVYEDGDGDGIRVRLYLSCRFPETGDFLTSDWFPANGYVVAGAERAVYVFSTEQPESPLYCVPHMGCGFLACHPFLPFVGCLSFGRSVTADVAPDACGLHVLEWTTGSILRPAAERRILEAAPRHGAYYSCSWRFSFDLKIAVCNVKEGVVNVLHLAKKAEEELETTPREMVSVLTSGVTAAADTTATLSPTPTSTATAAASGTAGVVVAPTPPPPPSPSLYTYTRECELLLPLHSLVNIEFISAATHALPDLVTLTSSSASASTPPNNHDIKNTTTTNTRHSSSFSSVRRGLNGVVTRENILAKRMLHSTATCNKTRLSCKNEICVSSTSNTAAITTTTSIAAVAAAKAKVMGNGAHACNAPYHDSVGVGVGPFSHIVGVNCAGEVASILVDADASITPLRPGCFALGFSSSLFLVPTTSTITDTNKTVFDDAVDIEQRMRRRLAAGFGVPAATNVRALQTLNEPAEEDLRILFAYISTMEKVGVVESSGPVPSIIDLLSLESAPSTAQLVDLKLLPHNLAVVCRSSRSRNDSRRLLLLHLLNWLPSQDPILCGGGAEVNCDMVERVVALEVLYNRRSQAASLLQHYHYLNPTYLVLAGFLSHHDGISSALRDCAVEVRENFIRPLSPWLRVTFLSEERTNIYTNTVLPFWDRLAIAVLLEYDTPTLVSFLSRTFRRECNMVQQLLLEGINEAACPLMQTIVDCTGDFQLAACLFARIVPQTHPAVVTSGLSSESQRASPPNVFPTSGVHHAEVNPSSNSKVGDYPHQASYSWKLWADAYRRFLDDEQEFVKRTMFDLVCQQLHGGHAIPFSSPAHQQQQQQQRQWSREEKEDSPMLSRGAQHTKPESNPLLHILGASDQRCCAVCSEPVYIRRRCARESFAWCTACLHGGHADHIQRWFETHSKCPVYGCGCRCEQGENLS